MNNGEYLNGSLEDENMSYQGVPGFDSRSLRDVPEAGGFKHWDSNKRSLFRKNNKSLTACTMGKIEEVKKFIHKNYLEDISREGLAAAFCLSPDHLGRMFLRHTGKRIGAYICRLRIHEASRRLLSTDDGIIRIAHDTGFESLRSFNRAFYERMGMTPSEYRRLRRK